MTRALNRSKTAPRAPQGALRRLQERSKRPQDGPKSAPRGLKTAQRAPKGLMRLQDGSRDLNVAPRGFKMFPRDPKDKHTAAVQQTRRSVPLQSPSPFYTDSIVAVALPRQHCYHSITGCSTRTSISVPSCTSISVVASNSSVNAATATNASSDD